MEHHSKSLIIEPDKLDYSAIEFCDKFLRGGMPRYVFGCTPWARSIAEKVELDGFIDDVVQEKLFCDKPVIRSCDVPNNSFVISAVVLGRPLTAMSRISKFSCRVIDYFAFWKYSKLVLDDVMFLRNFEHDFKTNYHRYEWLLKRLKDRESRRILNRLINFRLSRNLNFMDGFVDAQDRQYFEPFLKLQKTGESFLDVGCYDGFTSLEFIKRCPNYKSIHVFEPDISNMKKVKSRLAKYPSIHFHPYGVYDKEQNLYFKSAGSASGVSDDGTLTIEAKRIDDLVQGPCSFLKMDIEGGEIAALQGSSNTIIKNHPKLAISAYHKTDDLWRIPEKVLEFRDDYHLYLRHYTEGVTETVMFFVPK